MFSHPVVFKAQLSVADMPEEDTTEFSLLDYKVDFNDRLGSGNFGIVYGIIERPASEKTIFASQCPLLHDYLVRTPAAQAKKTRWCVKISKSFCTVALSGVTQLTDALLGSAILSYSEKAAQYRSYLLLRRYRLTDISFPITTESYAQFKERVVGGTILECYREGYFTDKAQYHFRKAYVHLLWAIRNVPLYFEDLNPGNFIYNPNSRKLVWVDGSVVKSRSRYAGHWIFKVNPRSTEPVSCVLRALDDVANQAIPYTREVDTAILEAANKKPTPQEYPCITADHGYDLESAHSVVNYVRQTKRWLNLMPQLPANKKEPSSDDKADAVIHRQGRLGLFYHEDVSVEPKQEGGSMDIVLVNRKRA